ncbi:hypothetical protein [Streptomyces colonosanans]|uniref:Uncharacterized protein n=1 Tax=Streptomyces colonosanans TaxID=1428652 RepID=A0A1S2PF97_9ACTN|nr:hypothetical protein [Streptomyces colonosanans]OIJ91644.1 hypothetical protein BIV24_15400 [Streptomyces colonosanans]
MNAGEQRPAFGLSFDPRALTDLLQAPSDVRDLTLAYLQEVVNAQRFGLRLTGDLEGYRKLFVDSRKDWRVVYGVRAAPEASTHRREIHVVAVRPRAGNDVYDEVGRRLGMTRRPLSARTHAARSRSPQLTTRGPVPRPGPLPSATPGLPHPAQSPSQLHTR